MLRGVRAPRVSSVTNKYTLTQDKRPSAPPSSLGQIISSHDNAWSSGGSQGRGSGVGMWVGSWDKGVWGQGGGPGQGVDDTYMTPQGRPDFVALGLKTWIRA